MQQIARRTRFRPLIAVGVIVVLAAACSGGEVDTSAPSTVNGGDGNDTFLVGQFYANPRTAPYLDEVDAFDTTPTSLGHLSNGVSRPAVQR